MKHNLQLTTYNLQLKKGFTLLEILVVIAIIAILVTLGLPSFATAQKKSRDAKRKTDVRDIQSSLEQYYSVCGYLYPTPSGGVIFGPIVCTTPGISMAIMPTVPLDPRNSPYYCPTPACSSTGYTICTNLESETPSEYCLKSQQ